MEKRTCQECGDELKGRVDQRFCNDQCRTTWNNRQNSDTNSYMRNINNILRKNRKILEGFTSVNKNKVHADMLRDKGFNFSYHTYTFTNKDGKIYKYCYEQGYLNIGNDFYFLVVSKDFKEGK